MRTYSVPSPSDDIPLYNQFTVLFPSGEARTKKSCNPLGMRNGDGMKKPKHEVHSPKSREEKPRRNNPQSGIAHDQKNGRPATDGQLKSSKSKKQDSFKPSKSGSRTQRKPPSAGEGFSLEYSDISWPFAGLKLPIRVCVFACIIWLIKCYIMSSLDTRYTQMQIQMETLTSTINGLQQGIPPTDEEYQTWMNYEGFAV